MSDRKKKNKDIINMMFNQEELISNKVKLIESFEKKYGKELEEYTYVGYDDFLFHVRLGCYIRYVNLNGELRWGGILIGIEDLDTRDPLLKLMNTNKRIWQIRFAKHYVFFKKHKTYNDRLREVFLSYLDNY